MNKRIKDLLEILICGLNNEPLNKSYDEWEILFKFAKAHSVENLFYNAIKDVEEVPVELKEKTKSYYHMNIHQQISQDYYAEQIFNAMDEKNISYVPLKGYYLRKLYPTPELRTSCDVDFFYDETRTEDLNEIMQQQGFIEGVTGPNHSVWQNETVTFEPHFYLLSDNDRFHEYYENVWSRLKRVSEKQSLYAFSDEDFYIFFIVHAVKHFTHGGFGIRTVLDIYVYNKSKVLNKEYLNLEFEKLGLVKFVKVIEKLAECWFATSKMDEDIEKISNFVIESGTYGVNLHNIMINNVKTNSVKKSTLFYFFKTLFLPYKEMKLRYTVLQKAPILLPFYWVRRWFEVLFVRRKQIKKTVDTMQLITSEEVVKYSKILEITEVPLD